MDKRIYSYNLTTYIYMITGITPKIYIDEEQPKMVYFVFPQNDIVSAAINAYKQNDCLIVLHKYLNAYLTIRKMVQEVRHNGFKSEIESIP